MATWRASVTALVKTIVGAGVLGLPFAFAQTGFLVGIALLSLAAATQLFALHLLAQLSLSAISRAETPSYRSFALQAFGSATGAAWVEAINAVHCFGTGTSYLIVIGDLCPPLVRASGVRVDALCERRVWIALLALLVELPLFSRRTLDALKLTSAIGNAAVALVAALTALFAAGVLHPASTPSSPVSVLPPPDDSSPLASKVGVLGVYVFAFACAMNLPTLVVEMERPSVRRVGSALSVGVGLSALLYLLVGGCGAVAFGDSVSPNLLLSFPTDGAGAVVAASGVVARLAMLLTVIFTYPMMMHPSRNSTALVLFSQPATTLGPELWGLLTLGLFACSVTIAMLVDSLDLALGLVGGSTGMLIGFIFPAIFYYQVKRREMHTQDTADEETTDSKSVTLGDDLEHSTAYRLIDHRPTSHMRNGAFVMAVGGTLLIPVLVGAQVLKIVGS